MERLLGERRDDHAADRHAQLVERRREQVVGQRPLRRQRPGASWRWRWLPTARSRSAGSARAPVSLRMTTCWLDGMWTRTLSTTISTSRPPWPDYPTAARPARRLPQPPRRGAGRRRTTSPTSIPGDEPADVGEDRDPAGHVVDAERGQAVDDLQDEPQAEDEDRRHLDELEEEAQEDERQDPGAREQHEVRAEHRGDRPRRADQRDVEVGSIATWVSAGDDPADEVEGQEGRAARAGPRRCCRRSTGRACCRPMCSQPPCRNWCDQGVTIAGASSRPRPIAAEQVGRDDARSLDERRPGPPRHRWPGRPAPRPNTTKQATMRASVTTGVRRVGLASRSGITGTWSASRSWTPWATRRRRGTRMRRAIRTPRAIRTRRARHRPRSGSLDGGRCR